MKKIILFGLISCMLFSLCACGGAPEGSFESNLKGSVETGNTTNVEDAHDHDHTSDTSSSLATPDEPEEVTYSTEVLTDLKEKYIAEITVQDYGVITVELDSTYAPITVSNFVTLAKEGFYDGLTFHRIMKGFMMQGGDPEGTGFGGSEKSIKGEFVNNGVENKLSHTRGVISMARATDMNSASSQFFIMHSDAPYLDGAYASFGKVVKGMDIVDSICSDANPTDDNGTIPSEVQPVITSIKIIEE
jgi:peptidyl-prolyl cis-trans isomerase B (cyclophilin B)